MAQPNWMIYGANGYTGERIAREAVRRGLRPVLASRHEANITPLARELDCPRQVFSLDEPGEAARQLADLAVVLHCAGPFSHTAQAMIDACCASGAHYLDITGEIAVIEQAATRHEQALAAGVCLVPAVGFDVVPTDCLAAQLHARLPTATRLDLAFWASDGLSPGTARTIWEHAQKGIQIRANGRLVRVSAGERPLLEVPFRDCTRLAVLIPWGDVASAYHTTGIPNIEVYIALPKALLSLRRLERLAPLAGLPVIRPAVGWLIHRLVRGPSDEQLRASRAQFWGRVRDDTGQSSEATLTTPGAYALTIQTALAAVARVLDGAVPAGFHTPSRAFGRDFIDQVLNTRHAEASPTREGGSRSRRNASS
jgi:saccharopine dehydrogenase (NAD+, L-lysine-forming)